MLHRTETRRAANPRSATGEEAPARGRARGGHAILLLLLVPLAGPAPPQADEISPPPPATAGANATPVPADPAPSSSEAPPPREAMQELLGALALALPRSADPARFGDPAERERIGEALRALSGAAGALERHAARGEGFHLLGAALARDAREVERRYAAGRAAEAGYLLQRLTENCIACHDRLPEPPDRRLDRRLVERMEGVEDELEPAPRARLQIATRRFDAALETYEAFFATPTATPARLDRMGYLADYLVVALRVAADPDRARATLRRLRARPDVPEWLDRDLEVWIDTLDSPVAAPAAGPADPTDPAASLDRARRLLARGEALRAVPADHTGLVHDVLASSLLYRFAELPPASTPPTAPEDAEAPRGDEPPSAAERAEAYYLLGLAESRIDRSYWLSPADLYLEASVRMAPGAPFARKAYALLEQRTREGYTGSSGTHLPEDVARNLDALRRLIERADNGRSQDGHEPEGSADADPAGDAGGCGPGARVR